jgi:hypothetical protein
MNIHQTEQKHHEGKGKRYISVITDREDVRRRKEHG